MFDKDIVIAFLLMALLFLRHIAILKKQNKIDYAPLMIVVGAVASLIHFIIHPHPNDTLLVIRESLMPLLAAFILYVVMHILNQTKKSQKSQEEELFAKSLISEITQLKSFMIELEERMSRQAKEEHRLHEEMRTKFVDDIEKLFGIKFEKMQGWYEKIDKRFENFSEVEMPEFDSVVHKHIEMLRVAEQSHYNKIMQLLQNSKTEEYDFEGEFEKLHKNLESLNRLSDDISKAIVAKTDAKFSALTEEFEGKLISLKLHAEGTKTILYEDENILGNIRMQSEMIMKQMKLSADQMREIEQKKSSFIKVYDEIYSLVIEIEKIKSDYVKAQAQLSQLSYSLQNENRDYFIEMKKEIDTLSSEISKKMDESLEKLYEHYHITSESISQSVKIMAKKAQLHKGYEEFSNKGDNSS